MHAEKIRMKQGIDKDHTLHWYFSPNITQSFTLPDSTNLKLIWFVEKFDMILTHYESIQLLLKSYSKSKYKLRTR